MTAEMIKSFYAYTPLWFWPVLWLQIKMMRAHLARLEARRGVPADALIGLGHCGTLRIVALSDASAGRYDADHWRPHYSVTLDSLTWEPLPAYVWLNILVMRVSAACLPITALTPRLRSLYLDPG